MIKFFATIVLGSGLLAGFCQAAGGGAPSVVWVSNPVKPGEAVYLQGNELTSATKLKVSRLDADGHASDWCVVEAIQPAGASLKFVLPASFAMGVFKVHLENDGGQAETWLNTPNIWWLQGDLGYSKASPGGWLRVFGRSLNLGGHASLLKMQAADGREFPVEVPARDSDGYSLNIQLPKDLAAGKLTLQIQNGYGGGQGWVDAGSVEVSPAFSWSETVYDITSYGAKGNDGLDDAAAIQAALDTAGGKGGGVVYLPPGQYHLGAMLVVPPGVTMRGESMETVALQWVDLGATETKESDAAVGSGGAAVVSGFQMFKTGEPLRALIKGTDHFRVEELTLYAWAHYHGIEGDRGWDGKGNIHLKRVRMRLYSNGMLLGRAYVNPAEEARMRRERLQGLWVAGFQAGGNNISVTDCDLALGEGHGLIIDRASGVLIARNQMEAGVFFKAVRGVIFEDNRCHSYWPSTHHTFKDPFRRRKKGEQGELNLFAECLYMARNTSHDSWGGDREITSLDSHAPFGFFFGSISSIEGHKLKVAGQNADGSPAKLSKGKVLEGAAVYIIDGRGAGQYRRVLKVDDDNLTITMDQPFQVPPDSTSIVSVAKYHGKLLYINETFIDGGDVQLWGGGVDAVFKDISMTRCGGYNQTTGFIYGGLIPLWFFEQFNTRVPEGNNPGGPPFKLRPARLSMNTYRHPDFYRGPIVRGAITRRTVADNNAYIELAGGVDGALVEDCLIKNSQTGILINSQDSHFLAGKPGFDPSVHEKREPANILLRNNRFENVVDPVVGDATGAALILK